MCGIAAAYAYAGGAPAVDRGELRAVRDAMALRGPDGSGEWFSDDSRVGLAHRRLSIIDLSARAAQPMAHADGNLVLTFNGEIYNHRELRAALEHAGRVFRTDSDTEVLLHLYEAHGTAMLTMLRGMFAFALWDARRGEMLLARDTFGIKPLYYADDGQTLRVASQVKALLRARVDTRPEPAGHAGFLLWGSVPSPFTLYRGIRALPSGHFMRVRPGGAARPERYASVSAILADAAHEPARGSRGEALEAIRASLQASIRAHLVADVPVGVFLSSGLDSGMLCAGATKEAPRTHALTLAFPEYEGTINDEAPLARAIAAKLGCGHEVMHAGRTDFERQLPRLLEAMDQPSIDGINTWLVASAAASRGMKVALSGLGGDELFASYPSFSDIPRMVRAFGPFAHAPRMARTVRRAAAPLLGLVTSPKYAGLMEYGHTVPGAYLLRRALFMPWEIGKLIDP
jgi:asparagine synthase (glutamine-hydrolysing)